MNPRCQFIIKEICRGKHLVDKLSAHAQGGIACQVDIARPQVLQDIKHRSGLRQVLAALRRKCRRPAL